MKSQSRLGTDKVCRPICQQKQNQFELLEHALGSHIYTKVLIVCHFFVFIKIHSKWLHPVLTSFAHCCSCQVLVQRPVPTCLDCFFSISGGNAGCYFCAQKENALSCQCKLDNDDSSFYLLHKKTILVVKIIVSLQNSPHHHLQTTFKDAEFIMLIYFLFIASHFSTLYYNIQRYFLFSLRTFH